MHTTPTFSLVRLCYIILCMALGAVLALSTTGTNLYFDVRYGVLGGAAFAAIFIGMETLTKGFSLRGFSTATLGLAIGFSCAWLLTRLEVPELVFAMYRDRFGSDEREILTLGYHVALYSSFGFFGAMLALRTNRHDFALLIPYVRFRQDGASGKPIVLDAESILDGRIAPILKSGFLNGQLIVPDFVLEDLRARAEDESHDDRLRAQRGLDCLETMQSTPAVQITIHKASPSFTKVPVPQRLIEAALLFGARLVTANENLTKVVKLQGVEALNLHDLDAVLKYPVNVGERVRVALVRSGKEDHQGVGYLADGTMVVVNHASVKIGTIVDISLISSIQTNAGTILFGELQ